MRVQQLARRFRDRTEGGRLLASVLRHFRGRSDAMVVGLPRGGVVTAAAVADELDLPLDVLVVRKLGAPGHEELALGAIGPGRTRVLNADVVGVFGYTAKQIDDITEREAAQLERQQQNFRGHRLPLDFAGKTVILVDDGMASGATMRAAVDVLRAGRAAHIVAAAPVGSTEACETVRGKVDDLVCISVPDPFGAVGYWYDEFPQVSNGTVMELLERQVVGVN